MITKYRTTDYLSVKQYLECEGWTVILFNTPNGDRIINKLGLHQSAMSKDGFIYSLNGLQYVFINSNLSEKDRTITLLHETGHIDLGHDIGHTDKYDEMNAWHYAYRMFNRKKTIAWVILFTVITALIVSVTAFQLYNKHITENPNTVYVTSSGTKFHRYNCYYINGKNIIQLDRKEAEKKYEPCEICDP